MELPKSEFFISQRQAGTKNVFIFWLKPIKTNRIQTLEMIDGNLQLRIDGEHA